MSACSFPGCGRPEAEVCHHRRPLGLVAAHIFQPERDGLTRLRTRAELARQHLRDEIPVPPALADAHVEVYGQTVEDWNEAAFAAGAVG